MAEKGEQGRLGGGAGVNSFQQPLPFIQPFPAHKVFFSPILASAWGGGPGRGLGNWEDEAAMPDWVPMGLGRSAASGGGRMGGLKSSAHASALWG